MISVEPRGESPANDIETISKPKHGWVWPTFVGLLIAIVLGFWLARTPPGFWAKLRLIGYAVCHQIPSHSFFEAGNQFPLCARCTGMYLGSLLGLGFTWLQGKRSGFPPLWVWIVFAIFFLSFALDGINSAMDLLPGFRQVYPSQNWLRLATGLGMGLAMGSLLVVAFRQAVWKDALESKVFSQTRYFLLMLLGAIFAGVLVLWAPILVKQLLMILSTVGVVVMLTLIYTVPASILLFGQSKLNSSRALYLPLMIGFLLTALQLGGFAYLRFIITGTLLPINL